MIFTTIFKQKHGMEKIVRHDEMFAPSEITNMAAIVNKVYKLYFWNLSRQHLNAPSIKICADSVNHRATSLTGLVSQEEHHLLTLDQVEMSLDKVKYCVNIAVSCRKIVKVKRWNEESLHEFHTLLCYVEYSNYNTECLLQNGRVWVCSNVRIHLPFKNRKM